MDLPQGHVASFRWDDRKNSMLSHPSEGWDPF